MIKIDYCLIKKQSIAWNPKGCKSRFLAKYRWARYVATVVAQLFDLLEVSRLTQIKIMCDEKWHSDNTLLSNLDSKELHDQTTTAHNTNVHDQKTTAHNTNVHDQKTTAQH